MGTDYDSRKRNKKINKRVGHAVAEQDAKAKRQRTKGRPKVRRLCKSPCWQDPAILPEDVSHRESDDEAAHAWTRPAREFVKRDAPPQHGKKAGKQTKADTEAPLMRFSTVADPSAVVVSSAAAEKLAHKRQQAEKEKSAAAEGAAKGPPVPEAPLPEALLVLPPALGRYMAGQGFDEPTPIQSKVWDSAFGGRDALGVAQPGSGKTLAYLLAMAARIMGAPPSAGSAPVPAASDAASPAGDATTTNGKASRPSDSPPAPAGLVLVPTRELAQQVAGVARGLRGATHLRTACVHGGADRAPQVAALQLRPQLLVATPGRLLDLLDAGALNLDDVTAVALDEADKMLSLGFEPQLARLRALLLPAGKAQPKGVRVRPQVLLCTATMPEAVAEAAAMWLKKPAKCRVDADASGAVATPISRTVTQVVQVCAEHKKPRKLVAHLKKVFANRVKTAQFLGKMLTEAGFRVALLHGKRPQHEREEAMRDFRSGKSSVLVATDVAGRGLHLSALPVVVNYDFPGNLDTYVHRVGRTGRLAVDGHALSFLTRNLAPLAAPLLQLLQEHDQAVDPNLACLAEAYQEAVERLGAEPAAPPANGDSSDDEEAALLGSGKEAAAGTSAAEDLFEGLNAILSGAPSAPGSEEREETADLPTRKRQKATGGKGSAVERAQAAPALSQHKDWAKNAHKLPPEALLKGAAVSKNVSRRPIGAPSGRAAASRAAKQGSSAGSAAADTVPVTTDAAAANDVATSDLGELPAGGSSEMFGDLPVGKRRPAGPLGGRLRKKLARQRKAAAAAAADGAVAAMAAAK